MLRFEPVLQLPFVTKELPGIGGELRAEPDDFVVEEIPLYAPSGQGQHVYVRLTKAGLATKDVQIRLARLFGLPPSEVGFAGMKDKHARTTQTFSLNVGHQHAEFLAEASARISENLPVVVHWVQFHGNKLKPGHLLGNRFEITVRQLSCTGAQAAARAAAIADELNAGGIPNYFGPQRFGYQGGNVRQGYEILMGQRRQPDRWLRKFLISSYQSHLCNRYLAQRLEDGYFDRLLLGDVAKKVDTGGIFDVEDLEVEQSRYLAKQISFTAPIFGAKMRPAKAAAAELEERILAEQAITLDQFRQARTEGTRRLGRLFPSDLAITPANDGLLIAFSLTKGAFATTVLREFMKVDLADSPSSEDE